MWIVVILIILAGAWYLYSGSGQSATDTMPQDKGAMTDDHSGDAMMQDEGATGTDTMMQSEGTMEDGTMDASVDVNATVQ